MSFSLVIDYIRKYFKIGTPYETRHRYLHRCRFEHITLDDLAKTRDCKSYFRYNDMLMDLENILKSVKTNNVDGILSYDKIESDFNCAKTIDSKVVDILKPKVRKENKSRTDNNGWRIRTYGPDIGPYMSVYDMSFHNCMRNLEDPIDFAKFDIRFYDNVVIFETNFLNQIRSYQYEDFSRNIENYIITKKTLKDYKLDFFKFITEAEAKTMIEYNPQHVLHYKIYYDDVFEYLVKYLNLNSSLTIPNIPKDLVRLIFSYLPIYRQRR